MDLEHISYTGLLFSVGARKALGGVYPSLHRVLRNDYEGIVEV